MRFCLVLITAVMALRAQSGTFTVHMILHAIGEERYETAAVEGGLTLTTTFQDSYRGNQRTTNATLRMKSDHTPLSLEVKSGTNGGNTVRIEEGKASVQESTGSRTFAPPEKYFAIFGSSPFAL